LLFGILHYHCRNKINYLKTSFHIKPDEEHNPSTSILLLIAGTRHCSFAVMNYVSKELVEFGYFTAQDEADYLKFLEETGLMNNRYYQTAVGYDANESVQIPSVVYKNEAGQLHLDTLYGKAIHTNIVSENLPALNLYNIYRLPVSLHSLISRKFLTGKFWHLYTIILKNFSSDPAGSIFIDFKTDEFSVVALKANKLLLCKTFAYTAPEDVLFYLLKCCQQLNLSQQQVQLSLAGLIEKDSALYRELYKYFINLEFDSLSNEIKLATALKIHPPHFYSSISKLAACVL